MRVIVAVPRRSDGGSRDLVWSWVADRWRREHSEWDLVEGHHNDGPFNRAAAINQAVADAGDGWDVAVVADADSFAGRAQVASAVELAAETGQLTIAHSRFRALSKPMSDRVMDGFDGAWEPGVALTLNQTHSSIVAVPRALWDKVGGFDEGFNGWGGEDVAFKVACEVLGGGVQRVDGDVWHLWHPEADRGDQGWRERLDLYTKASSKQKMRNLLKRLRTEPDAEADEG